MFEEENNRNWQLLHLPNLHTGGRSGNYNETHFCEAINYKPEFHCEAINYKPEFHFQLGLRSHNHV